MVLLHAWSENFASPQRTQPVPAIPPGSGIQVQVQVYLNPIRVCGLQGCQHRAVNGLRFTPVNELCDKLDNTMLIPLISIS